MNEKTQPEAEIKDSTMEEVEMAIHAVVGETVKLLESLGKALGKTVQDASNLMLIKVDNQIRDHLDTLVESGLSKNRHTAVSSMIEVGIKSKGTDFEKIQQTKEEIEELRKQMQSLVYGQS